MVENDIYKNLANHLNEDVSSKFPQTRELFGILEILFTPEQAEVAIHLPTTNMGRTTIEGLAKKMNRPVEELGEMVETMAKSGTVMAVTSRKDGRKYYALWPVIPGMMESTYADGVESEERHRLSELWKKYFDESFFNEQASSDYPLFRIIPINQNVDEGSKVLAFEEARNLIMAADVITVIPCHCRAVMKKCDHILEADFVFGAWADYLINYRGARKWTHEEALQRLKECEEDGLVHLTGNAQRGLGVICNCCPCCCGGLRGFLELDNPRSLAKTNFLPKWEQELCTLCMKCVETCPMKAVGEVQVTASGGTETRIQVTESECIGCGLCAAHCPEDAIEMVKVRDELPAETVPEMMKMYNQGKAC